MPNWIKASISYLRHPGEFKKIFRFEDNRSETRMILRQPAIVFILLVLVIWYILSPTQVIVLLLAGLGGIFFVSFFWARQMFLHVDCDRKLHYTAFQVGDELEEQVRLKNDSTLPVLWAEFVDNSNIPEYTVTSVQAAGSRSAQHWRAETICQRRGVYRLGPWKVVMGEPFDIFRITKIFKEHNEIVVYPPLAPVPPGILPRANSVGSHKQLHQPVPAETIIASSTRPFVPGDPFRRIHWKTTARRQAPFVKMFEPESATSVWLIPDFDESVQAGEGLDSTLETMVVLTASIASNLLDERLSVGLFLNASLPGDPNARPVTVLPRYGRAHLWTVLRALAPVEPAKNRPFEQTISLASSLISSQDMVMVITPSFEAEWMNRLRQIVKYSSFSDRRLNYTKAILLNPGSFQPKSDPPVITRTNPVDYLTSLGISSTLINKDDIQAISGAHGALRRWEFKTLGTGRVVVRQVPRKVEPGT
jgi:uncharacterized protein (DUF58 family)